ncbi:hypothetical protein D0T56_06275 [Dysgonomonas sp. 520]|nr:hypothetical protein [Dysgonomonas sp. 520]
MFHYVQHDKNSKIKYNLKSLDDFIERSVTLNSFEKFKKNILFNIFYFVIVYIWAKIKIWEIL